MRARRLLVVLTGLLLLLTLLGSGAAATAAAAPAADPVPDPPIGEPGYARLRHRKPAPTKDGWMTLLPYTAAHWRAFFTEAGREDLITELGVNDPVTRNANIDKVYAAVAAIAPSRTTAEWLAVCERLDIPATGFSTMRRWCTSSISEWTRCSSSCSGRSTKRAMRGG